MVPDDVRFIIIFLSHTKLILADLVTFHDITAVDNIICIKGNSAVVISGKVNFSYNYVAAILDIYDNKRRHIMLKDNRILTICHNEFYELSRTYKNLPATIYPHPFCFFQYFASSTREVRLEDRNFLITFNKSYCYSGNCFHNIPITNCFWLTNSLFTNIIPPEVNNHHTQIINYSGTYKLSQIIEQSSLSVCTDELHYDCHINDLGYLYPGQTLTVSLYHNISGTVNAIQLSVILSNNIYLLALCLTSVKIYSIQTSSILSCITR